jgi:ABC-type spermidine/putrescine transport system permease subunit II
MRGTKGARGRIATALVWALLLVVLAFLYGPLLPPMLRSLDPTAPGGARGLSSYAALLGDARLLRALWTSLVSGLLVAVIAPVLALAAAQAVRVFRLPRLVTGLVLLPLFVPGVAMGVASALGFRLLDAQPSLLTIVTVQVIWALPFAFLVVMTSMATFDPVYLEAAHMSGAGPWHAFLEVELPLIRDGLQGAALFSLILSFNETIRTALVQGGRNTVATYIWSQYLQVGLSPSLFALMTLLIAATLALVVALALVERRVVAG